MVKANERIEGSNKRIQVPKGIPIGSIFAKQNTFKYNKKLFAWQRNPSWSSQLRRDKFVASPRARFRENIWTGYKMFNLPFI